MARTGLAQDPRFEKHLTGPGHPERPERLVAIGNALAQKGLTEACVKLDVQPIDPSKLESVHTRAYVDRVREACCSGQPYIDVPDSAICSESYETALLASGAVLAAVDAVVAGKVDNAFCAVRPPGHHAERDRSMGFCLFNNIALAAAHLLDDHGLQRVLILDWDVHHGNGTQHLFESEPRVLFVSLHGHPDIVYPGTGYAEERGRGPGEGFTLNIPMLPPGNDEAYRRAFGDCVLPKVAEFAPQFVLISAGFDAHRLDPLAPLELETDSFAWMTDRLVDVARGHCNGRLVSVLEGGYHLDTLADCVAVHIARLREGL